ncbi:MAG: AAA family ATPase [Stigonema ocellatum SAG 48.90 = DSM 106950]|nr:AAA family ATPase [Stigonema ocellatum SAG 48.90 = DSM 106950]
MTITLSLPTLWVADLELFVHLGRHFAVLDLINPPTTTAPGLHYILVDANTPLAAIWRAGYLTNGTARVYQCQSTTDAWVGSGVMHPKELIEQIFTFSRPWAEWVKAQTNQQISVIEARDIAAVIIKYAPFPMATLEQLRQQCKVSSWDWKAIINELRQIESKAQLSTTERLRLEIQRYATEPDPIAKALLKSEICSHYRISEKNLNQLVEVINQASSTAAPKLYTAAEFMRLETGGVEWLFPGLLLGRGVTILGGDPGIGKTTLAYDAAVSLLLDEEFLGEKPTKKGKVLFVASDELPCFVQDKLATRGAFAALDWAVLMDWDVSQWQQLEDAIAQLNPTMVVIDSFSSIHNSLDFDENAAVAKHAVSQLEALSNTYGFGCILIHHNNKNRDRKGVSKLRGSSGIGAAASAIWILEGENNSQLRRLSSPKIRSAAPIDLMLKLNPEFGRWEVTSEVDVTTKTCGDRIIELLSKIPENVALCCTEIAGAIGWGREAIYKALQRLSQRGILSVRPSTTDPRHKVYRLAVNLGDTPTTPSEELSNVSPESVVQQEVSDIGQVLDNPIGHQESLDNVIVESVVQLGLEDIGQTLSNVVGHCSQSPESQNDVITAANDIGQTLDNDAGHQGERVDDLDRSAVANQALILSDPLLDAEALEYLTQGWTIGFKRAVYGQLSEEVRSRLWEIVRKLG